MTAGLYHVVRIADFSYDIGGKRILDGVTLDVASGEFLSVIGANGAGKTTLLKCIVRISEGGTGSIDIMGRPAGSYPRRELARLAAYVPQSDGRSLPFTVEEFVRMARYPYMGPFSSGGPDDDRAVTEALELTGTDRFADRMLDTLSGGERQTALIAAALAQGTPILLLDEPTAFLDPRHVEDIHRILTRINRERGVTVMAVTHDINGAALMSDRVAVLKDGRIVVAGPPRDIMRDEVLSGAYGKRFLFVPHPVTGLPVVVPGEAGS